MTRSFHAALRLTALMFVTGLLAPGAAAQNDECHGGIELIDAEVRVLGTIECSVGYRPSLVLPAVAEAHSICPHRMIVYPAHAAPRTVKNSGYRTEYVGPLDVKVIFFRCETDYFLFFALSDDCIVDRQINAGVRDHYRLEACDETPGGEG